MRKEIVIGVVAVVAVFGGVLYFAMDRAGGKSEAELPAAEVAGDKAPTAARPEPTPAVRSGTPVRPVAPDPRLAALMVSPPNALIEFVPDAEGRVIKEIDTDPASASYKKPLREYMYAGDKVVGLTSYKYLGDQTQITKVQVTYKPDGSVDKYVESQSHEFGKGKN